MKAKLLIAATMLGLWSVPALAETQIFNVAATDPNRVESKPLPVNATFGPGDYSLSLVGKAGGGLYDAWSVAAPAAGNWDARFDITANGETISVNPYNGQRFATAADALAAFAGVLTFTLDKATDVTFSIPDYLWWDNTGGVSIGVTSGSPAAVPEPATMGLFAVGGAMMLASRRRRKAAART